jgi:hypothetical protein
MTNEEKNRRKIKRMIKAVEDRDVLLRNAKIARVPANPKKIFGRMRPKKSK